MLVLGISCYYHDSAACLLRGGEVVAAAHEERFSRLKHDWRFPLKSIDYCLREGGAKVEDIAAVVFYEKPILKFERILETFLSVSPRGMRAFLDTMPSWLKQKLWVERAIRKELGYKGRVLFSEHHLAHAASSFFASPFEEAAVLTVDGVGEWATASFGHGKGNRVTLTHEMRFPNSLGLLYSAFTSYLGFEVNDGEYKVMGMAPYGTPAYFETIKDKLIEIKEDGSLGLKLDYFAFHYGRKMFNKKFERLFGGGARTPGAPITGRHFDLAASIQKITEEVLIKMARHALKETGMKKLCLAGGVSLNCAATGRVLRECDMDGLFIQPAAGDAGGAMGAAYLGFHHYMGMAERRPLNNIYLGPSYTDGEIGSFLNGIAATAQKLDREGLIKKAAALISEGKVVGWFQGRMEFGPRALGNRSILADPRRPEMKDTINNKVKFREAFRPFAPSLPLEDVGEFFAPAIESPYMLLTSFVKSGGLPAVTHIDGTARLQTVRREDNPLYYDLLKEFGKLTGVPVLLNTSLNLKGEPIALNPADALGCYLNSGMDALVLGNFLLVK